MKKTMKLFLTITIIIIAIVPFKPLVAQTYIVGQKFEGGIIYYVDSTGHHGLIAATNDQAVQALWYWSVYEETIPTGTKIGTGYNNTADIVDLQGEGEYAANICHDLVIENYSGWFLPSIDELNLLYLQKDVVGGFTGSYYWSSSESGLGTARAQDFRDGSFEDFTKDDDGCHVRAIRAF